MQPPGGRHRRLFRVLGRLLVIAGAVLLGAVLWHLAVPHLVEVLTARPYEQAQARLAERFEAAAPESNPASMAGQASGSPATPSPPAVAQPGGAPPGGAPPGGAAPGGAPPAAMAGEPVARLSATRAGDDLFGGPLIVVEGVGADALALGPGRYPDTPLPGEAPEPVNTAIAGHRTTYGSPFRDLGELRRGDLLTLETATGSFDYTVVQRVIVGPDAVEVLEPDPLGTGRSTLTLTTCHPIGSDAERLVVVAEQLR